MLLSLSAVLLALRYHVRVFTSLFTFVRSVLHLYLWIPIACPIPGHEVPQYSTAARLHTRTNHVNSRILPGVPRMICVSAETPREDSDRSECITLCRQKAPPEGTVNNSQNFTKRWCVSEPCACRIQTVRRGQEVRIRATGNW